MGSFGFALAGGLQGLGAGIQAEAKRRHEEAAARYKAVFDAERDDLRHTRAVELQDQRDAAAMKRAELREEGYRSRAGGRGLGTSKPPKALSASVLKRIEEYVGEVGDPVGGEAGQAELVDLYAGRVEELMREEGLSETEAERRVRQELVFEEDVPTEGFFGRKSDNDWMPFNEGTQREPNTEGRGVWSGRFTWETEETGEGDEPEVVDPEPEDDGAGADETETGAGKKLPVQLMTEARAAMANGAPRDKVIARLQEAGYNTEGL